MSHKVSILSIGCRPPNSRVKEGAVIESCVRQRHVQWRSQQIDRTFQLVTKPHPTTGLLLSELKDEFLCTYIQD